MPLRRSVSRPLVRKAPRDLDIRDEDRVSNFTYVADVHRSHVLRLQSLNTKNEIPSHKVTSFGVSKTVLSDWFKYLGKLFLSNTFLKGEFDTILIISVVHYPAVRGWNARSAIWYASWYAGYVILCGEPMRITCAQNSLIKSMSEVYTRGLFRFGWQSLKRKFFFSLTSSHECQLVQDFLAHPPTHLPIPIHATTNNPE